MVKLSGGPGKKGDDKENGEKNNNEDVPVAGSESSLFRLYPNPNDGYMQLEYQLEQDEQGEFLIYDVMGRVKMQS